MIAERSSRKKDWWSDSECYRGEQFTFFFNWSLVSWLIRDISHWRNTHLCVVSLPSQSHRWEVLCCHPWLGGVCSVLTETWEPNISECVMLQVWKVSQVNSGRIHHHQLHRYSHSAGFVNTINSPDSSRQVLLPNKFRSGQVRFCHQMSYEKLQFSRAFRIL